MHRRQQELRIANGLRRAGLREHLDEHADFHIASTSERREKEYGPTLSTVPGATTVITEEMVQLLKRNPVVITTAKGNPTIPGTMRFDLPSSGTLADEWQAPYGHHTQSGRAYSGSLGLALIKTARHATNLQAREAARA